MHGIAHVLGLTNASGYWYLLWSGFFADITIFGAVILHYRKQNCHVHGCWRISHRTTPEGHAVCRKHNPEPRLTHAHLIHLHRTRTES